MTSILDTCRRDGTPVHEGRRGDWPKLMTVERAARELSVSRVTIYELMKCGALKSVKIGASRRIVSASVEKVVSRGATRKQGGA
jgi:excisionase family DNA binding protein